MPNPKDQADPESLKRGLSSPEIEGNLSKKKDFNQEDSEMGENTSIVNTNNMAAPHGEHVTSPNTELAQGHKTFEDILQGIHEQLTNINGSINELRFDLDEIKLDMKHDILSMQKDVAELTDSVSFNAKNYDSQSLEIKQLKEENKQLKKDISEIKQKAEETDQYSKRQNILFDHVEETDKENTHELVINMCEKVGILINKADIQASHRLAQNVTENNSTEKKSRVLIARFTSVGIAKDILTATKRQFGEGKKRPAHPLFAREHLTQTRSQILKACLGMKRDGLLASCWVFNYYVHVKKKKSDTKGIKIACLEDLKYL